MASAPSITMTVSKTTARRTPRRRANAGLCAGVGITLFAAQAVAAPGDAPASSAEAPPAAAATAAPDATLP
ncbi:signal peptide protein, partial [Burkholderia multivorans]|nr:signal peptide protein [Burkholderia multivorans]